MRMALNLCKHKEILCQRKASSLASPDFMEMRRPKKLRNVAVEELIDSGPANGLEEAARYESARVVAMVASQATYAPCHLTEVRVKQ